MPHGQLNPFAQHGRHHCWSVENKAMIEEGFGRVAMDARALESNGGRCQSGLHLGHLGHFDVRIDGATVCADQILAANN